MTDGIRIRVSGDPGPEERVIIFQAIMRLLGEEDKARRSRRRLSDWQLAALKVWDENAVDWWSGDSSDGFHRYGKGERTAG